MPSRSDIETTFYRVYKPLCLYALRILEDYREAEEAVHRVFARVLDRADELEVGNLQLYLYRAVREEAMQCLLDTERMVAAADLPELSDEDIATAERDARLWSAVDALPRKCREVFLLSRRDGMTPAEIAAEAGISIRKVEKQLEKALCRLSEAVRPGMPAE